MGSTPGCPRQMGQILVFGGFPNLAEHPQNIFVSVNSCAWTSNPITASYFSNSTFILKNKI
jgi:hypothetical protein